MRIRTVLDLRPQKNKYLMQILLLAASWHQNVHSYAPLEICTIGRLSDHFLHFLKELGIRVTEIKPNQNDYFSRNSNTFQGLTPVPDEQILLIDNDVYFFNDISPLSALPKHSFYGCQSDGLRVYKEHWELIKNELDLHPLEKPFIPPKLAYYALRGKKELKEELYAYPNGGVILVPPNYNQIEVWQDHQKKIYDFFKNHPLAKGGVTDSNMAALATSIGEYGKFSWLPYGYNYMWSFFVMGLCDLDEIKIVHMTGDPRSWKKKYWKHGLPEPSSIKTRITDWWQTKITDEFEELENYIGQEEKERRQNISNQVLDAALAIAGRYNLESLL